MDIRKFIYLFPAALLALCSCRTVPVNPVLQSGKIMFWGDSTAEQNTYPGYFEAFYRTRYPQGQAIFVERCWPGDHSGNLERIRRDGMPEKADLIYIMYGLNQDECSSAASPEEAAEAFRKNLLAGMRLFREANPGCRFVLMSPPALHACGGSQTGRSPWFRRCQALAMEKLARNLGIPYIDQNLLFNGFAATAAGRPPALIPTPGSQADRAAQVVLAMNMLPQTGNLSVITYDHAAGTLTAEGSNLSPLTRYPDGSGITFSRQLHRLPFALPPDLQPLEPMLVPCELINRDLLIARNLQPGRWELRIEGVKYGTFSADELAKGINLSQFGDSPDMLQARKVMKFTGIKNSEDRRFWTARLKEDNGLIPDSRKKCGTLQDPDYLENQCEINGRNSAIMFHSQSFFQEITLIREIPREFSEKKQEEKAASGN